MFGGTENSLGRRDCNVAFLTTRKIVRSRISNVFFVNVAWFCHKNLFYIMLEVIFGKTGSRTNEDLR